MKSVNFFIKKSRWSIVSIFVSDFANDNALYSISSIRKNDERIVYDFISDFIYDSLKKIQE